MTRYTVRKRNGRWRVYRPDGVEVWWSKHFELSAHLAHEFARRAIVHEMMLDFGRRRFDQGGLISGATVVTNNTGEAERVWSYRSV